MADVVANGVRHHVQRFGRGERTVVFIHGLVMDNLSSFYFTLANPIAERADVILYDLRGHGMSERPATGYTVETLVADLAALLDALEVTRPVDIVGNSFGGLLALAFAAAHPERVARLALIDAHTGVDGWAAQMTATLALQGAERDTKIFESFKSWLGRHSERKRNRLAKNAQELVERTSLVADLRGSPALALGGITATTLALYGETSDVRVHGEALARALPNATLVVLPGCTHSVLWEATAEVRARVVGFIRDGAA
jgi:pimeloyl-ACP methyl ester carboxylesterase